MEISGPNGGWNVCKSLTWPEKLTFNVSMAHQMVP